MMSKVEVSIIIPVYNVAPFLDECLSSCINQTFRDLEIIVVNDGSTDESEQIIIDYAAKDQRVITISKRNEGLIYARKSGLDVARGTYVFHLDGDDSIETNAIEMLHDEAVRSNSDYVIGHYYEVYEEKKEERRLYEQGGLSGQDFVCSMVVNKKWTIWGRLIQKTLFDNIIYRSIFMGEDLYFNMQIGLKVKKMEVVNAYLYNYNRHSGSVTVSQDDKCFLLNLEMLKGVLSLLKIYDYRQSVVDALYIRCLHFFLFIVKRKKNAVISIFLDYLKKEGRDIFDWKRRLPFYLIHKIYLCSPFVATFLLRLWLKLYRMYMKLLD